jgi:hypothetical protein
VDEERIGREAIPNGATRTTALANSGQATASAGSPWLASIHSSLRRLSAVILDLSTTRRGYKFARREPLAVPKKLESTRP